MIQYIILLLAIFCLFIILFLFFNKQHYKFYISIASIKGYEHALDNLLSSFPPDFKDYIIIYSNEDDEYYEKKTDGHYEVHIKRNITEYGAWEGLYMLKKDGIITNNDYILMLHDTCKLGNDTIKLSNEIISNGDADDIFWASKTAQNNICITKGNVIDYAHDIYDEDFCKTFTKKEGIYIEWSNDHPKSVKSLRDINQNYYSYLTEDRGKRKVYSDVERNVVYFRSIDIEKYYVFLGDDVSKTHPNTP